MEQQDEMMEEYPRETGWVWPCVLDYFLGVLVKTEPAPPTSYFSHMKSLINIDFISRMFLLLPCVCGFGCHSTSKTDR